jgi:HEAT repeats
MTHQDGPEVRSSADSLSFNAYREAERITDEVIFLETKAAVVLEKNKKIRAALYFLIAKVAVNLRHSDTSNFLIEQLRRETDKYVLKALLDRIAELPKSEGTDLQPILERLEDPRWLVRLSAIQALKLAVSPNAELALVNLLERSTDPYDINFANATLNQIGSLQSIPALERHLSSRKRDVKDSAQLAIQAIRERHEGQKIATANRP